MMDRRDFLKLGSLIPGIKLFGLPKPDEWRKHADLAQQISAPTDMKFYSDVAILRLGNRSPLVMDSRGVQENTLAHALQEANNAFVAGQLIQELDPSDFDSVAQYANVVKEIAETFNV